MTGKSKFVPMGGIDTSVDGILETSGLVACIAVAGYVRKGDRRQGFLSHYPAQDPTLHLSRIITLRERHPELGDYDVADILIFRLRDEELSEKERYVQPDGSVKTYMDTIGQIRYGLSYQFPGARIKEVPYKTTGKVKLDVDNDFWESNGESGHF